MSKQHRNPYGGRLDIPVALDLAVCPITGCTYHCEPGRHTCHRHDQRQHVPPPRRTTQTPRQPAGQRANERKPS